MKVPDVNDAPGYVPIRFWCQANQSCYARFRRWLRDGGYSASALSIYSCGVRLALGRLRKPYPLFTVEDLDGVRQFISDYYDSPGTRSGYLKGLAKFAVFLRQLRGLDRPPKQVNWPYFLAGLPPWLATAVRDHLAHLSRSWLPENHRLLAGNALGTVTRFLRWASGREMLSSLADLTPELWYAYVDQRLAAGISASSLNGELSGLLGFMYQAREMGVAINPRFLLIEKLKQKERLPRDVPPAQLRAYYAAILEDCHSEHAGRRRMGLMDRAWFLLMLHGGLRVGEVRRLRLSDLELDERRLRVVQSKGLKDRTVFISDAVVAALEAYLPLRGPSQFDHVFIFRHRPLCTTYCAQRMRTFGKRCGYRVVAHQLRHSFATLLLNAGAPILTVKSLLGHKHVDTTLIYARLYDRTMAGHYRAAMRQVESQLALGAPEAPGDEEDGVHRLLERLAASTMTVEQQDLVERLRERLTD